MYAFHIWQFLGAGDGNGEYESRTLALPFGLRPDLPTINPKKDFESKKM